MVSTVNEMASIAWRTGRDRAHGAEAGPEQDRLENPKVTLGELPRADVVLNSE